jgi:hypothetical protein
MNNLTDKQQELLQGHLGWCGCECGLLFTSLTGFDKHHAKDENGDIICLEPAEVGLVLNDARTAWQFPKMSEELKQQLYG